MTEKQVPAPASPDEGPPTDEQTGRVPISEGVHAEAREETEAGRRSAGAKEEPVRENPKRDDAGSATRWRKIKQFLVTRWRRIKQFLVTRWRRIKQLAKDPAVRWVVGLLVLFTVVYFLSVACQVVKVPESGYSQAPTTSLTADEGGPPTLWKKLSSSSTYWLWLPVCGLWTVLLSILLYNIYLFLEAASSSLGSDDRIELTHVGIKLLVVFFAEWILAIGALKYVLKVDVHVAFLVINLGLLVFFEYYCWKKVTYFQANRNGRSECFGRKMGYLFKTYDFPAFLAFLAFFLLIVLIQFLLPNNLLHLSPEIARTITPHETFLAEDILVAGFAGFHFLVTSVLLVLDGLNLVGELRDEKGSRTEPAGPS